MFIGSRVFRVDGFEKCMGITKYIDDYFVDAYTVKTIRSPKPHIKIKGIKLKYTTGLIKLITSKDLKGKYWKFVLSDYPFLATHKARFIGEAIALIVADTEYNAQKIVDSAVIEYEELPGVFDPVEAMKSKIKIYGKDNIFTKYRIKKGRGFIEDDVVVEGVFKTGYQVHMYMEPMGMIATYENSILTVYGSMQCPFYVLDAVCQITGLPKSRVRILQTPTGGGFGGKEDMPSLVAAHVAIASYLTGRPCKLIYDREEDFISMSKRHPSYIEIKYSATKEGRIKSAYVKYILNAGAYSTLSPIVLWRGTVHAAGPYEIENVFIESYAVATNTVPCGAFRGFGQPQVNFANESLIDDLADKLGIDPFELREKNILKKNSLTHTGQLLNDSCGMPDVLRRIKKDYIEAKKRKEKGLIDGYGIACNFYGVSLGARGRYLDKAYAKVSIQNDGSVNVFIGNTEIGQGAKTVIAQIAATSLGCPVEVINVNDVDTSAILDSGPTVASRTTLMSGNAVIDACKKLKKTLDKTGSKNYFEKIKKAYEMKLKLEEIGFYNSPPTSFDFEGEGQGDAYVVYSYTANLAEIKIDRDLGTVKVVRFTSAHDFGSVINPSLAEGQIEGGISQAIGYALYENLVVENGKIMNPTFTDYVLQVSTQVPEIKTYFVPRRYSHGPFGAKGLAESPIITPAASIRNAIKNATGILLYKLPMLPEDIVQNDY